MPDRAALITALILERPTCEPCIVERSWFTPAEVETTLTTIQTIVKVSRDTGRCRVCGATDNVVSVERPA